MPTRSDRPFDVGYGRPPRERQFQPGQSGNPSGRPKVRNTLQDVLREVAAEKIRVNAGGQIREVTKARLIVMSAVDRALKGDAATLKLILPLMVDAGAFGERDPTPEEMIADLTPAERADIEAVRESLARYATARDEDIEPFDADGVGDDGGELGP